MWGREVPGDKAGVSQGRKYLSEGPPGLLDEGRGLGGARGHSKGAESGRYRAGVASMQGASPNPLMRLDFSVKATCSKFKMKPLEFGQGET